MLCQLSYSHRNLSIIAIPVDSASQPTVAACHLERLRQDTKHKQRNHDFLAARARMSFSFGMEEAIASSAINPMERSRAAQIVHAMRIC